MVAITPQEIKSIQISILKDIDRFCKSNNIQYYLFAGSLIGAVRHKGVIPWDDDIDICMKREDYNYFFKTFNSKGIPNRKAICLEYDEDYYSAAGKVIDTRTSLIEAVAKPCELGVFVDIFPMDYLPEKESDIKRLNFRISGYRKLVALKNIKILKERIWYKNVVLTIAQFLLKPIPMNHLLKRIASIAQTYKNDSTCTKLADISVFTYGMKEVHERAEFATTVEMEFEGSMFSVPVGFDKVLQRMYGDYMKLPPKEKQVSHHVNNVFWKE